MLSCTRRIIHRLSAGPDCSGAARKKREGIAWPSNVVEAKSEGGQGSHSAPFPRALVEFFIKAFSDPGDIVFDPFMGSGTTLAAAHVLGRNSFGCEISPAYCDVIIGRMEKLGCTSIRLAGDGRTFAQVARRAKAGAGMICKCCGREFMPKTPRHRVLCGDATVQSDLQRLMAGDAGDLVFTDPPYNVDYEGYTEEQLKIHGDKMTPAQFKQFLRATFTSYRAVVKPGASLYVCHSSSWQREFQNAMEAAGFEVRCQIIWAKNTFAWGFGRYKFQHEPIFYATWPAREIPGTETNRNPRVGREEAGSQPGSSHRQAGRARRARSVE